MSIEKHIIDTVNTIKTSQASGLTRYIHMKALIKDDMVDFLDLILCTRDSIAVNNLGNYM